MFTQVYLPRIPPEHEKESENPANGDGAQTLREISSEHGRGLKELSRPRMFYCRVVPNLYPGITILLLGVLPVCLP